MTQNSNTLSAPIPGAHGRNDRSFAPHDLLSEKEVAGMLGIATGTMRNWRSLRTGPVYVKIGQRTVRYRCADVEAFISSGMAPLGVAA